MELTPVSVLPLRPGDHRDVRRCVELADTPGDLAEDLDFLLELILIRRVLVMASAARPEVRATRLCSFRRRPLEMHEPGMKVVLLLHQGLLPGKHKWSEHDAAIDARQAIPSVNE